MKERSRFHQIPIYDVNLEVVVTDDIAASSQKPSRKRRIGEYDDPPPGASGLMLHEDFNFCVMFMTGEVDAGLVAHEVYHVAASILHRAGVDMSDNDEACAYLVGYLVKLVTNDLRKFGERVK